jgi:hypothetical protein
MTDKLSHWLQGGALVAAVLGLYLAFKKNSTVQATEQSAPANVPSPSSLDFGGAGIAPISPGAITVGGDPLYLTYNYPPATDAAAVAGGVASNQPVTGPITPSPRRRHRGSDCGCSGGGCPETQFTTSGLSGLYETLVSSQLSNLTTPKQTNKTERLYTHGIYSPIYYGELDG